MGKSTKILGLPEFGYLKNKAAYRSGLYDF